MQEELPAQLWIGESVLNEQSEKLWRELNEVLMRMEQEDTQSAAVEILPLTVFSVDDQPLLEFEPLTANLTKHFRRIVFESLSEVIRPFNDEEFVNLRIEYYKRYYELELDKDKLLQLYLVMQAHMIRKREALMLAYLKKHFEEMCHEFVESIITESGLSISDENASILEHPVLALEEYIPGSKPPLQKDIQARLVEPFNKKINARLGINQSKPGRRTSLTLLNQIDGILPRYQVYLKNLERLKTSDGKNLDETEKYLYSLAISGGGGLNIKACQALIEKHDVKYTDAESLYNVVKRALLLEKKIVHYFKERF